MRQLLLTILLVALFSSANANAQDTNYAPKQQQIPGPKCTDAKGLWLHDASPCTEQEHQAWLTDVRHWRDERLIRIGYDGSRYARPELRWTQSSFIQPQMMVQDRYFYDPSNRKYTVDRYLDDLQKRFGGIDSV